MDIKRVRYAPKRNYRKSKWSEVYKRVDHMEAGQTIKVELADMKAYQSLRSNLYHRAKGTIHMLYMDNMLYITKEKSE